MIRAVSAWLGGRSRLGLVVMALIVGAGAGVGAAGFRELVFFFTWLVTGHQQFGQQGHAGSLHLPWLGIWFVLIVPVIVALIYGPLIQRFAREARGHGVPEVMLAVAENGGRIRLSVPRHDREARAPGGAGHGSAHGAQAEHGQLRLVCFLHYAVSLSICLARAFRPREVC